MVSKQGGQHPGPGNRRRPLAETGPVQLSIYDVADRRSSLGVGDWQEIG